jgi:hypothetical protein
MVTAEIETEGGLRNVVAAIASTLRPAAMIACPASSTILLPGALPLPGTLLCPSALLLPGDGLLPVAERRLLDLTVRLPLLGLLDPLLLVPLLLLRLLNPLLPLRLLLLRLLSGLRLLNRLLAASPFTLLLLPALLLLLLRLPLRTLLLRGWRFPLAPALLPFWLALLLIVALLLRVARDSGPEKQQQSSGAHSSNELHSIFSIKVDIRYARRQPVRLVDPLHDECEIILCLLLVDEGANSSQNFI